MKPQRRILWLLVLVLPSLACQAVLRLVSPPETIPWQSSTATTPPANDTPAAQASCLTEFSSILREANNEHLPLRSFPNVDIGTSVDVPLVIYGIRGDELSVPALENVPAELLPYQREFTVQKAAWNLFTAMIPADQRRMLAQFEIITDGPGGVLSAVEQTPDDPNRWILETDIADMPDTKNLAFTLLHEFGHLLTLNSSQVPPDLRVFNNPNSVRVRERAISACTTYFPGEGCSLPTSYVNNFFNQFWNSLYSEWSVIDQIEDQDRRDARLESFYHKYSNQFVDSYAANSPVEDIAETWAYFVLSSQPSADSVADQKIRFFYAYPELVALRDHARVALCAARP